MADRLAKVFGTEDDRVNCPFYAKIGTCRHGDRCSRLHNKPLFSQSICFLHLFSNPLASISGVPTEIQEAAMKIEFEDFFIDIFDEAAKHGEVSEIYVCDNISDHLIGNVYVKYCVEEEAQEAMLKMNGRLYHGRMVQGEYSPVTEFDQARCRQYDDKRCTRGGHCNFLHFKEVREELMEDLMCNQPHFGENGDERDKGRIRRYKEMRMRVTGARDKAADDAANELDPCKHIRGRVYEGMDDDF